MQVLFPSDDLQRLRELTDSQIPKSIVITTHHKPDGDALGSSLGLMHVLQAAGHRVTVVSPSEFPSFLDWMNGSGNVVNFIAEPDSSRALFQQAELVFCLDFNDPSRVDRMEELLSSCTASMVLIDHHLDPKPGFCNPVFSYPSHASTSELLVHLIVALGFDHYISRDAAECFYAGIMTDTGGFRFNSVSPGTHAAAARMLEAGCRNDLVHERIYDGNTIDRLRLLGHTLLEKMRVYERYRTVVFAVTEEEMDRFHHAPGDLEGIVNYGLSVHGICISVLFSERDGLVKISFRSKGPFSVKTIAERYFSGGGHRNAAGGRSGKSLEEAIQDFIRILPQYESELNESYGQD
ncbi:MAG: DHH family phosphoesterase [Bacteroidota bacterium]